VRREEQGAIAYKLLLINGKTNSHVQMEVPAVTFREVTRQTLEKSTAMCRTLHIEPILPIAVGVAANRCPD
jgi:hypothetical protein